VTVKYCWLIPGIFIIASGCSQEGKGQLDQAVEAVATYQEITSRIEKSDNRLIAFEFYADWCGPCRILAPTIEKIAKENRQRITFYRVNIDRVPNAAGVFNVQRIPAVIFIKNKEIIDGFAGIQSQEKYQEVIDAYSSMPVKQDSLTDSI
jgi:thioredoxin 1